MKTLIEGFPEQLKAALEIGRNSALKENARTYANVVITGLGGSGIGGKIVADVLRPTSQVPLIINNGYTLPGFVGKESLVIVSSYSGNTEETVAAMEAAIDLGAEVACITSGGRVVELAKQHDLNIITVPSGHPPRACLGYSLVQQFVLLKHYGIHSMAFEHAFEQAISLIESNEDSIRTEAKALAQAMHGKTPVLYAENGYEGMVIRLRQQLNENAKQLCWHHVLPEMNHNELVGWGGGSSEFEVFVFSTDDDLDRNQLRTSLSTEIIGGKTNVHPIFGKGNSKIERTIYLINLGDWISWYLSELNGVDAIEIDVINYLKKSLAGS